MSDISALTFQHLFFEFRQEKPIKGKTSILKGERLDEKVQKSSWKRTACHVSRRTKGWDRRMRQSGTMCPHPGGPANDLTVLGGQYGISCWHPGARHWAHHGMCCGHMAGVFSLQHAQDFPIDFHSGQIFQIRRSSRFLRANYHLQLCFISSQEGDTSNWLDTSS